MNYSKTMSINKNLIGVRSWLSCLQLAVALVCWSSLAQAQFQTETWVGTNTSVAVPYGWTNTLNWNNAAGAHQAVSLKGDALIFGASPTNVSQNTFTNTGFGIYSITFTTNGGYVLSGNALQITNGITDNADGGATPNPTRSGNSESMALTIGASQTFANNSTVIGTNSAYFTNTESGTINLSTNVLTVAGSAPFFLTGAITSTNGGQVVIANFNGYPNGIARLSASNSFGINVVQVTNIFNVSSYVTNYTYYTNVYVVITNGVTNYTYFYVTNTVILTNGAFVFTTNTFGPQNRDAVVVQSGGTLQVGNSGAIPSATSGVGGIGNLSVDGTLDLNGTSLNINGLDDAQSYGGSIDNLNPANTGTYTLTLGYGNSNAVFTGVIGNNNGVGATAGTVALTKTGYGTETLANANYYAGPTLINQGKLVVTTGGSLGELSALMTIQPGAVLDVSGLGAQGYLPQNPLTVAAGTPTKPYTNFLGSYDPIWGTNPTNYVVTTSTNYLVTYATNTDLATYTNVVATTNIASFGYSTNSIISTVTADVYGNFTVNGGGAISPLTPIAPGIATWAIQGNLTLDNSLGLAAPLNKNRMNFLLNDTLTPGGGTNDLITVSGKLTIGDELDFVITPLNSVLAAGKYTLMTSSSYVPEAGHTPTFNVILERGLQGDTVTVDPLNPNNIVFNSLGGVAHPGSLIWAGTAALPNWDVDLSENWATNGPTYPNPDYFFPIDAVTFADNGISTVTLPVVVNPGSVHFINNKTNITFAQSQSTFITGSAGGFVKDGSGTVTIQNPNSLSCPVTVNSGILALGYYNNSSFGQAVLYNAVPAQDLIMGGGEILQNGVANVSPETDFQDLIINPGASAIYQQGRQANEIPVYTFSNNVVRLVGGVVDLNTSGKAGSHGGVYFIGTNSPDGTNDYGNNHILGGFATMFLNDWVYANTANTTAQGGNSALPAGFYQTQSNPALWGANSNVAISASVTGIGTQTINSLKLNTTGSYSLSINSGQALSISSGGILVPTSSGFYNDTISGGTLMGAVTNDLIILNNNIVAPSVLTISSVIADNGGPCGLTSAGGGTTVLTGNNTYTGPTYIDNGIAGSSPGTLQIGNGAASGSIASSSAVIDNGNLAFNRSDNTSVGGVISGSGGLKKLSAGVLTLTANNSLSGLVTISGGTLQLGNGGASGSVSNTTQIVDNGALVFDNNSTVGYPSVISGFGSLVQFGTGNLVIATNETYVGGTVVSNGTMTLTASGSISNTVSIAVQSGATLDVSAQSGGLVLRSTTPAEVLTGGGSINGSVTTGNGTTVQPSTASGAFSTMTISGNFTMNGGGFVYNIGNANHDRINVGGTLTENGGTIILNITGGLLNAGVYILVHGSAIPGGSVTNLAISGFNQPGQIAQLIHDPVNNNLDLLVSGGSSTALTWVGDGSANVWDLNNTPNWNNGSPGATFGNQAYTTFDDTGSASPAVNIKNIVSPNSISNNAVAKNYTLGASTGSSGRITGGASLTQNGTSQLTLQTVNDYLGATVINAGTVQLGNNTAAAEDGMVGYNNSVVVGTNAMLVVSNFATETLSGSLSGSGQLVQQGNGKLILTGNNSAFAGAISVVTNGSSTNVFLQMGNGFTGTLGTGTVTNNRSLLLDVGPTYTTTVAVNANITGSGGITNIGNGIALLNGTNTFTGNTLIDIGTIQIGSGAALPATTTVIMDTANPPGTVGTLDLNGHDLTIGTLSGSATGQGTANFIEPLIVNNGSTTNTLTLGGGTATSFSGQILDNNNGGSGKLALMVINNTALTLNPLFNNAATPANLQPNLFTAGLIISNASVQLGTIASSTDGNGGKGVAAAGAGVVTLEGGLGAATNSLIRMPTNAILYSTGSSGSSSPTLTSAIGVVNVPAGQFGTIFLPQRGTFSCTLNGSGTIIVCPNYVRGEQGGDWTGFTGTIIFESMAYTGSAGSAWSINQPLGYPNATLFMQVLNTNAVSISGANGGNVFPIGALTGGDSSSLIGGGTQGNGSSGGAANTIWAIGGLNLSTTNGSQIVDGGCGLRKVGTGTLTLTNNTLSFGGQLVISNGVLALAPLGQVISSIITNGDSTTTTNFAPINYLTNTTYLVGSNVTVISPGVLDLSQVGDHTLHLGHNGSQSFFGDGTIKGNLIATNNLIAPAWGVSGRGTFPGPLTITGNAEIDLGSTIQMAVSPTAYDSLNVGGTLTINKAAFTVISTGGTAFPPTSTNVFQFFQAAVPVNLGGASGITNITVFTNLPAGMFWVTNLNGTLSGYPTVPAGAMAIVNTNANTLNAASPPVQVSVSGSTLTLGWPTNLGWILQSQTNGSGVGLTPGTNWFDVAGSAAQTNAVITMSATNPAVFYRLRAPTAPPQ